MRCVADSTERSGQVVAEIFKRFESDGEPDQRVGDAEFGAVMGVVTGVRHGGRLFSA